MALKRNPKESYEVWYLKNKDIMRSKHKNLVGSYNIQELYHKIMGFDGIEDNIKF